mmetsp:Transcript_663/g.1745  ORF Transcript_663/g.1745 Transcript_663/m.1745 type:complete len:284 (+) Transcript_663:909-1760(+)
MLEDVASSDVDGRLVVLAHVNSLVGSLDLLLQEIDSMIVTHGQDVLGSSSHGALVLQENLNKLRSTGVVSHRPAYVVGQEVSQANASVGLWSVQNPIFVLGQPKERELEVVTRCVHELYGHSFLLVIPGAGGASDLNASPAGIVQLVAAGAKLRPDLRFVHHFLALGINDDHGKVAVETNLLQLVAARIGHVSAFWKLLSELVHRDSLVHLSSRQVGSPERSASIGHAAIGDALESVFLLPCHVVHHLPLGILERQAILPSQSKLEGTSLLLGQEEQASRRDA